MKKNKSAFSIVIAMWLVLIMTMLVLYILEYMIPYSKNVKWIENSSNAFYQAENSIEDALYFFSTRWTGSVKEFADKEQTYTSTRTVDYKYDTTSSWNTIPYNLEWNSDFDTSFNTISQWNPIQLKVWKWVNIDWDNSSTEIFFNVPDLNKDENFNETLSWSNIINWQISSDTNNNTLNASWSFITVSEINSLDKIDLHSKEWINLYWTGYTFDNYYTENCEWTNSWCTLKFSVINKLELTDGTSVPYLEYKFNFNTNVPLRYSRIKSSWKSYGFQKHLEVKIPQQTTNEAFDFAVFQ